METYGGGGVVSEVLMEASWLPGGGAVMRTTFSPGSAVPLHAHPEPETHLLIEGFLNFYHSGAWIGLQADGPATEVAPGDRHAMRNASGRRAVMLTLLPGSLLTFIREVMPPHHAAAATAHAPKETMIRLAERRSRGYVDASKEENAEIGIVIP